MSDLAAALGLVLVLEGALYALGPGMVKRLAARVANDMGEAELRIGGLVAAVIGLAVVWLVRG
ncbi:MAG: DUF2065 domain-containing protein [Rhodobiaceae bacterium]|nr:DUF2065 domain-containing protein [Rhodobiaceae bacterium]